MTQLSLSIILSSPISSNNFRFRMLQCFPIPQSLYLNRNHYLCPPQVADPFSHNQFSPFAHLLVFLNLGPYLKNTKGTGASASPRNASIVVAQCTPRLVSSHNDQYAKRAERILLTHRHCSYNHCASNHIPQDSHAGQGRCCVQLVAVNDVSIAADVDA